MADVGEIRARLVLSNEDFKKKMNETRKDLEKTSFSAEQLNKDFGAIQKASTVMGTAIVATVGASVKKAAEFESGMARVKAISGATEEEFSRLEAAARKAGAETVFSATDASDALSYLAMAGFDVNSQISALPSVLNAAAAGQIELGTSADIVSNIMTGFGLSAEETEKAVDVLVKTMTSANTDLPMLGDGMKYVAPVAAGLGLSLEETAAAMGKLSDAGIQGSQSGTVLRAALLSLTNPTGQTVKAMEKLNIEVLDAEGNMKSLPELIGHVSKRMEGMTEAQKVAAAAQLVGTEAASGFIALLEVGEDGLRDYTKELENSAGTAQKMADIQNDTLIGSFKEFQSALEEMGIKLGNEFLPLFTEIVRGGADVVRIITDMDMSVIKTGLAFGGTTAAIALTISTIGKLVIAARGLMASMGPAGWLIAGLSIVGGLFAANNIQMRESEKVNLDHAKSLIEQQQSLEGMITNYEKLREKNKLTNDELGKFVDLQNRISRETDPEKIEKLQEQYNKLLEKSGLSNDEMNTFLDLNDKIIETVPESNVLISDQGKLFLDNTDAARKVNDELRNMIALELDAQRARAEADLDKYILEYTESLEEANKAIEERNEGIKELERLEYNRGEIQKAIQKAEKEGNDKILSQLEHNLQVHEGLIHVKKNENAELAETVVEKAKSVAETEKEFQKVQAVYDELINVELQHVGITAAKGEGIKKVDEEIKKLQDAKKKLEDNTSEADKKKGKYTDAIKEIETEISKLETTKSRVKDIAAEQSSVNDRIIDGQKEAGEMNQILSEEQLKNIKFVGNPLGYAKQITDEAGKTVDKTVNIWERVKRIFTGSSEKHHSGGIVGSDTAEKLPKFHSGGIPAQTIRRLQDMPLHNEIDARLLKNEMVLTESQQANLFKMIDIGTPQRNTEMDTRVLEVLTRIERRLNDLDSLSIEMDGRTVGDIVTPTVEENINRKRYIRHKYR